MDAEEIAGLLDEFADWLQYAETTTEFEDDDYRVDLGSFGEQSLYVSGSTSVDLESEVQALAPSGVDSPADFRSLAEAVRSLDAAPVFSRAETREYDPLTVPIERDSEYVGWKDLRLGDFVTSIGRVIKIDPATGAHTVARRNDANDGGVKLPVVTEDYETSSGGRSSWSVRRAIGGVQAFRSTAPFDPKTAPLGPAEENVPIQTIKAGDEINGRYRALADAQVGERLELYRIDDGASDRYDLDSVRDNVSLRSVRRALPVTADQRRQVLPEPTAVA